MTKISTEQFIEAVKAYKDSDHVNPTSKTPDGVATHCLYLSEIPSPTGAQRCLVGQVLHDLGLPEPTSNMWSGIMLGRTGTYGCLFENADEVAEIAGALQAAADNSEEDVAEVTPQPWSVAIAEVLS